MVTCIVFNHKNYVKRKYFLSFFFLVYLGPHSWYIEVPRLGVESELQLSAYTTATATATLDLSYICDLHHSSEQLQMLSLHHSHSNTGSELRL